MQLFSLTGVPPDRQKVMISGTMIAVNPAPYLSGYLIFAFQDEEWGKAQAKIKNVSKPSYLRLNAIHKIFYTYNCASCNTKQCRNSKQNLKVYCLIANSNNLQLLELILTVILC